MLSFGQRHPSQFRSLSFPNSASSTLSDPPIKQEPSGRFGDSPHSRPLSPLSSVSGRSYMDYRSPTNDNSSRSSTLDSDSFSQYPQRFPSSNNVLRQQKSRRSGSGSLLSQFDESAYITTNEVKRENYEQPIFSEPDSNMEETVRHLHLEDRVPFNSHLDSAPHRYIETSNTHQPSQSRPGMKRKQPPEGSQEDAQLRASLIQQAASAEQYSNAPQHLSAQSANQYGQHQGSISSQSSGGYRHNSYASSGGPSIGDSSYSSIDQHSPGGVSPTSDAQHYPHINSQDSQFSALSMNTTPQTPRSGPYPHPQQQPDNRATPTQKSHDNSRKQSTASIQSPFTCHCCPKKPKKFETEEALK